jgi:hypothetical protein
MKGDHDPITFFSEVDGDTADDICTNKKVLDSIECDSLDIKSYIELIYGFPRINAHQGPLPNSDRDYNESISNVLVEW